MKTLQDKHELAKRNWEAIKVAHVVESKPKAAATTFYVHQPLKVQKFADAI